MVKGRYNRFVWDENNPVVIKGRCFLCKHKHRGELGCDAFPEGLPHPIAKGDVMHWPDLPFEGDGGIRFELNPELVGKMMPQLEKELVEAGVASYEEMVEPLKYYDLERYLFETVNPRFECQGWLCAFDLISIVIWKAERSKSRFAKKLMRIAKTSDLNEAAKSLTSELYLAEGPKYRFSVLIENWSFRLPTASAILTVLYPEEFTVYDQRVCEQLDEFRYLGDRTNFKNLWEGYLKFKEAVKNRAPVQNSLRDQDRFLFGESVADQLKKNIAHGFKKKMSGS